MKEDTLKELLSVCRYYKGDDKQSKKIKFWKLEKKWIEMSMKEDPKIFRLWELISRHGLEFWMNRLTPGTPPTLIGIILEDYLKDHHYIGEYTISQFMRYYISEYCKG